MTAHSPLPWSFFKPQGSTGYHEICSGEPQNIYTQEHVATAYTNISDENAAFIVRACNAHYELLELLKDQQRWTAAAIQEDPLYYGREWLPAWQTKVAAAIAKAEATSNG